MTVCVRIHDSHIFTKYHISIGARKLFAAIFWLHFGESLVPVIVVVVVAAAAVVAVVGAAVSAAKRSISSQWKKNINYHIFIEIRKLFAAKEWLQKVRWEFPGQCKSTFPVSFATEEPQHLSYFHRDPQTFLQQKNGCRKLAGSFLGNINVHIR